jgi:hypothetical protein
VHAPSDEDAALGVWRNHEFMVSGMGHHHQTERVFGVELGIRRDRQHLHWRVTTGVCSEHTRDGEDGASERLDACRRYSEARDDRVFNDGSAPRLMMQRR